MTEDSQVGAEVAGLRTDRSVLAVPARAPARAVTDERRGERPRPRRTAALARAHPLAIDGDLDEAGLARGAPRSSWCAPSTARPPRQRTGLRLLWDDQHLYAAFRVADDDIRATHTRRDAPLWEEEVVELFLDPWGARRIYVEIEVSPRERGVRRVDRQPRARWRARARPRRAARLALPRAAHRGTRRRRPQRRPGEPRLGRRDRDPDASTGAAAAAGARGRVALQRVPRRSVGARRRAAGLLAHRPTGLPRPASASACWSSHSIPRDRCRAQRRRRETTDAESA